MRPIAPTALGIALVAAALSVSTADSASPRPAPIPVDASPAAEDIIGYGSSQMLLFDHYSEVEPSTITRIDVDGSIDRSFGDEGTVAGNANDIAVEPDGGILIASDGYSRPESRGQAPLIRLLPDGSPDRSFGIDGKAGIARGRTFVEGNAVTTTADGKILFAGSRTVPGGEESYELVAARLNPNGSLDRSFGNKGISVLLRHPYEEAIFDIAETASGDIVIFGGNEFEGEIWELDPDGSPDRRFGKRGYVALPEHHKAGRRVEDLFFVPGVAVSPSGGIKLVAEGYVLAGNHYHDVVLRLRPNGRIDRSFGERGWATAGGVGARSASPVGLTPLPGGALAVASTFDAGRDREFGAVVFGPDGRPLPGYSTTGGCRASLPGSGQALGVADLDGQLFAVGVGETDGGIALLPCGGIDLG